MDKIAVLVPCYNESKSIAKVIRDIRTVLPEATIYVYDNNSTDGTDEIARKEGAVVRYERQQGKGNVIRSMFRDIDAECYLMVDGDDTYPAEFAPEMCRKVLEEGVDMVVGDRLSSTYFTENKRPFHNFGNTIVRAFINRLFRSNIKDIMTGYRAMSYQFVKTFPVLSGNFEFPFLSGTASTNGLFPILPSMAPHAGIFGHVFVQQIPIQPFSAACHP